MRITKTQYNLNTRLSNTLRRSYPVVGSQSLQESYNRITSGRNAENSLTQPVWIEALPKYQPLENGFKGLRSLLPSDKKDFIDFLESMHASGRGDIFPPFTHQAHALEAWASGKDFVVSTGTGSGKTECFLWPMLGHLHNIAKRQKSKMEADPKTKSSLRGIKTIVLYPMNALVGDQLKRLRTMLGDFELAEKLANEALYQGGKTRFFQFGSYTGRTRFSGPYAYEGSGANPKGRLHKQVTKSGAARKYAGKFIEIENNPKTGPAMGKESLYLQMMRKGLLPAKGEVKKTSDGTEYWSMGEFIDEACPFPLITKHTDRELLFRHEMHNVGYSHMKKGTGGTTRITDDINGGGTPDVLITNYSMLEYMLKRPLEHNIFLETRAWLAEPENKIQLVLDEAHLYQGALGTEIGMLLRRLRMTLGIGAQEEKIQFILTSASLGKSDSKKRTFVEGITGRTPEWFANDNTRFIEGVEWEIPENPDHSFNASEWLETFHPNRIDVNASDKEILQAAVRLESSPNNIDDNMGEWFDFVRNHELFFSLYSLLKKEACSITHLSDHLFGGSSEEELHTTEVILNFVAYLQGETNIPNLTGPLLGIRAHLMYKGLGEMYWNLDEDKIQTSPSSNILSNSIQAIYAVYSCRRCGGAYAQVFIESEGASSNESAAQRLMDQLSVEDRTYASPFPNTTQFEMFICDEFKDGVAVKELESKKLIIQREPDLFISTKQMRFLSHSAYVNKSTEELLDYQHFKPAFIARKSHGGMVDQEKSTYLDSDCTGRYSFSKDKCLQCNTNHSTRQSDQITSLMTRGDQAFSSLTLGLHEAQDPDDSVNTPNKGKKVLIFSDGRQRAARLAKTVQDFANNDELRLTILHLLNDPWYKTASKKFSFQSVNDMYAFYVIHLTAAMQDPFEESATYWSPREIFARNRQSIIALHLAQLANMKWVDNIEIPKIDEYPILNTIVNQLKDFDTNILTNKAYNEKFLRPVNTTAFDEIKLFWERANKSGPYSYLSYLHKSTLVKHLIRPTKEHNGNSQIGLLLRYSMENWDQQDLPIVTQEILSNKLSESGIDRSEEDIKSFTDRWNLICNSGQASDLELLQFFGINQKQFDKSPVFYRTRLRDTSATIKWVLRSMVAVSEFDKIEQMVYDMVQREYNNLQDLSTIARSLKKIELTLIQSDDFFRIHKTRIRHFFSKPIQYLTGGGRAPEFFFTQLTDYLASRDFSFEDLGLAQAQIIDKKYNQMKDKLIEEYIFDESLFENEKGQLMRYIFEACVRFPIIAQQSFKLPDTGKNSSRGISSNNYDNTFFGFYASRKHPSEYALKKDQDKWGTTQDAFIVYLRDVLKVTSPASPFADLNLKEGDLENFVHSDLFSDAAGGRKTTKASILQLNLKVLGNDLLMCTQCGTAISHDVDRLLRICNKCGANGDQHIGDYNGENQLINLRVEGPWRKPAKEVLASQSADMPVTLVRAEEHTAQINDPTSLDDMYSHAERFEMLFQDIPLITPEDDSPFSPPEAPIDILSCTTTMEVGIDIGSLTAVALRTVPRQKANYQQRVGRAGRGRAEVCVAMSWYDNRPYAQHYFNYPHEIIHHPDNSPIIYLENGVIIQRHIWAAIMQRFFKRLKFDTEVRMFLGMDLNQQKASLMDSMGTKDDFINQQADINLYSLDALIKWKDDDDQTATQKNIDGVLTDIRNYSWEKSRREIVSLLPENSHQFIKLTNGTSANANLEIIDDWMDELINRFSKLVATDNGGV
jgi:Lhr-like helicase